MWHTGVTLLYRVMFAMRTPPRRTTSVMRDTRTPRENEPRRGRARDDESRAENTWYEECARRPVDEPLIATIPLPDGQ
jgi:hypothetical protein